MSLPVFEWNGFTIGAQLVLSKPILFWTMVGFVGLIFLCMAFNPALNVIMKGPLWNSLGMKYDSIYLTLFRLKLRVKDFTLHPSKSDLVKMIILILFPSGNVMLSKNSVDYPESKITVGKLTVKIRVSSPAARRSTDGNSNESLNRAGEAQKIEKEIKLGWFGFINRYFPRPVLVIVLHDVVVHIEKVYLAPQPPALFQEKVRESGEDRLPLALPLSNSIEADDLPTFDQPHFLETIRNEELTAADALTYQVERWIDHAVTKLKSKGGDKKSSSSASLQKVKDKHADLPTKDEKFNTWIRFFVELLCQSITIDLMNACIVVSGAGSEYVVKTRKNYSPREANLMLAKLPKHKRSLTAIGADLISISLSPDSQCTLLLCLVGAYIKVGDPLSVVSSSEDVAAPKYNWYQVINPFECMLELKGVMSFLVFSLSYDHYWHTRFLELNLSVSEKNLSLSPKHIHTVFLHLDDYTDISPLVEWMGWLRHMHSEALEVSSEQKVQYAQNYAKLKGAKQDDGESDDLCVLTAAQMKELELNMNQWEILSSRFYAMRKHWLIPKENEEFSDFLHDTKSSIPSSSDKIDSLEDYLLSPFEQVYPSPLHALFVLVREKSSIMAPKITVTFSAGSYLFDFPQFGSKGDSKTKVIPSSMVCSGVEFGLELSNPLFQLSESSASNDTKRSFVDLSLQVTRLRWGLALEEHDEIVKELPCFRSSSPVGIIYEQFSATRQEKVLLLRLGYSVSPTIDRAPHIDLSLETSDLIVVVNPLPLLSTVDNLIELLEFPFQTQAMSSTESISEDNNVSGPILNINTDVNIMVSNISFIFLVDLRKLNRGLLQFNIDNIDLSLKTGVAFADLKISTGPFALDAARVSYHQSHLVNKLEGEYHLANSFENIECWLMPFKPILLLVGATIDATGKEEMLRLDDDADCQISSILGVNLSINTDSFDINASPTTIVAIRGVISSFDPILQWVQGDAIEEERLAKIKLEENERKNIEIQHQVLTEVWREIDVDGSGTVTEDELEDVVTLLWEEARPDHKLTDKERKRETKYLMSMLDRSKSNEISFQDLDDAIRMLAGNIDDNNLVSNCGDDFACSDEFLSSFQLRKLLYFDDLKEYSSMHIVNEMTGGISSGNNNPFPSPSLWRHGQGIDIFWEMYTKETGCSRDSLNGQSVVSVQRQLVRSFCNYEFAKFCWKSIVQPELNSDDNSATTTTRWLLDRNHAVRFKSGVTDLLREHVSRTKQKLEGSHDEVVSTTNNCRYDVLLNTAVNSCTVRFGSSHNFAKPLLETNFTDISFNVSAHLSENGFVETRISSEDSTEFTGNNIIQFQGVMSAMYLNTKHNHMESFIEPYPCFGQATYNMVIEDQSMHSQSSEAVPRKAWSVKMDCPRFFNVNTSPSFFETAAIVSNVISQTDPQSHREFLYKRDLRFMRIFWESSPSLENGCMDLESALVTITRTLDAHWQLELEGFSQAQTRELLVKMLGSTVNDVEDLVSFQHVEAAVRHVTQRCYFAGCEEIQLQNDLGIDLKVTTRTNFDLLLSKYDVLNEGVFQTVVGSLQSIGHGDENTVSLQKQIERFDMTKQSLCGNLSLFIPGFRFIEDIAVNPYQTLMFKLKVRSGKSNRRRTQGVSGFKPYMTVVPKSASLDTITLYMRSNIVIRSEVPVKIRIVRLGKSASQFSKKKSQKQNKKSIDLTKKYFMTALKRSVEGAPIVYERMCKAGGDSVALPLSLLVSSSFHAILIQDVSGNAENVWRTPLLFTKDYLFNPLNIRDVARYHTMTGVIIQKERRTVQNTGEGRHKASLGSKKKNATRLSAWDVTIRVIPSVLCLNSLPFPISVRVWQHARKDDEDDWDSAAVALLEDQEEEASISDDDDTMMTPSIKNKGVNAEQYHLSTAYASDYYHEDVVNVGETLRLSGVSLSHPLFVEVSQQLQMSGIESLSQTSSLRLNLQELQTGMNRKGVRSLPKLVLDLGDNYDCLVDVSIDRESKIPFCTFYSPYWLVNKTGMKLEYIVNGSNDCAKRYLDSGVGGIPVLTHCSKSDKTNETFVQGSREFSLIPLECPRKDILEKWWDQDNNGKLVLQKSALVDGKSHLVDWCKETSLDAAGTSGEIHCNSYVLQAQFESLAGAFHRSNVIKLAPRFIVKNSLHISISILPLKGNPRDARKMASRLTECLSASDQRSLINLLPGESTVIYNFKKIHHSVDSSYRWIAFHVNASRFGNNFKQKWHMVPLDVMQSNLFAERDGAFLCGIVEAKVHSSQTGSILTTIAHSDTPPFRIENRSQSHYLQFAQDDDEADIFELPPMHSCGYTWDSPLGKKRLRVAVVPGRMSSSEINREGKTLGSDAKSTTSTIDSDDESVGGDESEDPLLHSLRTGISNLSEKEEKKMGKKSSRQWVHTRLSRTYNLQKIGKRKSLHCPQLETDRMGNAKQNKSRESLKVHTRVATGTKVISFSDSDWLADQVEAGLLRRGGDFKSALIDINVEGAGIYFNDSFPRELMSILVRDMQIVKPMGSIEFITRVRHFQIDAMIPNARYPIIIQPLPLGVDRRAQELQNNSATNSTIPHSVKTRECFWKLHDEKPIPLFEMKCSYVPQNKMVWIPNLEMQLCPMKLQLDVNYLLQVTGLIVDSISKDNEERNIEQNQGLLHVHDSLHYATRGSMNVCLTYIEKFCFNPVEVQLELNLKSDEDDFSDGVEDGQPSSMTLHTLSQSINSEWAAGMLGWLINVGANFAHVSPTYTYSEIRYVDTYSDIMEIVEDVVMFYLLRTIKQSYKVIFSMQLLGDPSLLLHQWKTGVKDLVVKTAEEIAAGGKDGVGKGVSSLMQNVVGGTFFAVGRVTGSLADTITAVTTTDLTSEKLKPKSASSNGRNPDNARDGVVQGTSYLTRTVAHGIAGLIGNPYRGAQTGSALGFAKGVTTGVVGVLTCPFVGALGFIAKTSTGIGETSKILNLGYTEARCRPRRVAPWGMAFSMNEMPFLKGIGIRIHTVRYQKVRKRTTTVNSDGEDDDGNEASSRERRRLKAAEKRRLDPRLKQVSIKYRKDKGHYLSHPIKPKLLLDHPGNLITSHYAVTFEETIELRSSDLQLDEYVTINFWNHKMLKTTPRAKALAVCNISVGDMFSHALTFHQEQLKRVELNLAKGTSLSNQQSDVSDLILPAPQEYPLFRPLAKFKSDRRDIFEAINDEMIAIEKAEEDRLAMFASESDEESDASLVGGRRKKKDDGDEDLVSRNERLFGNVALSFFPIPW